MITQSPALEAEPWVGAQPRLHLGRDLGRSGPSKPQFPRLEAGMTACPSPARPRPTAPGLADAGCPSRRGRAAAARRAPTRKCGAGALAGPGRAVAERRQVQPMGAGRGGNPAQRRAGAGRRRGRWATVWAQDEGGHCWGSAAGRRTLRRRRAAQRCGGDARADAGPMARTTSQLVSVRRPPRRAGPPVRRARRLPRPGEARRPGVPRAGRRLTCGQAAWPRSAGLVGDVRPPPGQGS